MVMKDSAQWIVDSIEEDSVAVEQDGGRLYELPRFLFPKEIREGEICRVVVHAAETGVLSATVSIDKDATLAARNRSAAQVASSANKKDPGGPIQL